MPKTKINPTVEDYLRSIYRLEDRNARTSNTALARELNVSSAAVTEMMRRLAAQKLLRYEKYRGPKLTRKGRDVALSTTRRHRLWEVFLIKHLGYSWDEVHELAHLLEHIGDNDLIDRLDDYLGNPSHDPHGDPIPGRNGLVEEQVGTLLSDMKPRERGVVCRINDDSPELLRHASSLGLSIKARIKVLGIVEYDSSMQLQVGKNTVTISERLAHNIFVHPVTP